MKRKVKKFGAGGDILTGVGLGMIGYDLYKRLKGDDEKKEYKGGLRLPEKLDEEPPKAKPKEETREEYLEKRGAKPLKETGTRENPFYKEDEDKSEPEPAPKPAPKKRVASQAFPVTKPTKTVEDKPTPSSPSTYKPNDERPSKPYPSDEERAKTKAKAQAKAQGPSGKAAAQKNAFKADTSAYDENLAKYRKQLEDAKADKNPLKPSKSPNRSYNKGGKVKKYAEGGTATSKPEPKKKDTMPEWAKNERENRRRDELNKREAEGAAKEVKRNMSTFGFKKGGSASSRADGIAIRGKTRA
jgi:hypothetical protein